MASLNVRWSTTLAALYEQIGALELDISWGVAPGYINLAPLGLEGSYLSYERFLKKSNLFSF
ncbi:MAG: hypothetical protein DRR08_21705 [Candidatus Parabeggiatoa sp. nov. 2]|nr:MAG: hypothetical protein B6247_16775 [Beggiatoa sp. 4572_84]RKZ56439.1 MAG: hypothetical protein DRR08_21705 [Gammaproteobacteria bacterium]